MEWVVKRLGREVRAAQDWTHIRAVYDPGGSCRARCSVRGWGACRAWQAGEFSDRDAAGQTGSHDRRGMC